MPAVYFLESVDRVMKVLDAFTTDTPETLRAKVRAARA